MKKFLLLLVLVIFPITKPALGDFVTRPNSSNMVFVCNFISLDATKEIAKNVIPDADLKTRALTPEEKETLSKAITASSEAKDPFFLRISMDTTGRGTLSESYRWSSINQVIGGKEVTKEYLAAQEYFTHELFRANARLNGVEPSQVSLVELYSFKVTETQSIIGSVYLDAKNNILGKSTVSNGYYFPAFCF